jgi:integrase
LATITKRQNGWFVQIRRKGFDPEYRTFGSKADARKWAIDREARIGSGETLSGQRNLTGVSLGDLIGRYIREITPTKASAYTERLRLEKVARAPMAAVSLRYLSTAHISAYRDARARLVKPGTVGRELSLIHNVIEVARRDWGIPLSTNVVAAVRRIPIKNARDRRLKPGEMTAVHCALAATRNRLVRPAIMLAIETALRRGELLNLTWNAVDLDRRTIHIPHTKTGYARTIPMTDAAVTIVKSIPKTKGVDKLFPMTPLALRLAWNRVRERAGIPDLRFHDLRHEAISRFAEMGLSTVELAAISGHRDLRMLARYTHIQPSALARKLAGRSWQDEVGNHSTGKPEAPV